MSPTVGFPSFLLLTVVLLACDVVTGRAGQRRRHLCLVALTVASLGTTIYYAERLGELYDLSTAGRITPVHLALAKVTTLLYLAPVVTGVMTIRNPLHRGKHRVAAYLVLGLTVLTATTGTWMILAAERLPVLAD